jgi:putative ABC transport system permease protein
MRLRDIIRLSVTAVFDKLTRSVLTMLGITIGIAAVVLLTAIGEGINQYVVTQFTQFGSNIVQIQPGKKTTFGASLGVINTTKALTIDDRLALSRLPQVTGAIGFIVGNAEVEGNRRQRRTTIYGTDPEFPALFSFATALGSFLPPDNPHSPRATAVLGSKMRDELFGTRNPVGEFIRISGSRYRVVGVMQAKGQMLGVDLDDSVYLPTARAMELFNAHGLMEIDIAYGTGASSNGVIAAARKLLIARHGIDDVTILSQQQVLGILDSILGVLTTAVAGLGAISMVVGGIGILTVMIITVKERTNEIGLFRALGATRHQVLGLFLCEAVFLASLGGLAGIVLGVGGALILGAVVPALPVKASVFYILLSLVVSMFIGLLAGLIPARSATDMLPVDALRAE